MAEYDDRLIPGIHNYCDRWCERCPLTHRCSVAMIEARRDRGESAEDAMQELMIRLEQDKNAERGPDELPFDLNEVANDEALEKAFGELDDPFGDDEFDVSDDEGVDEQDDDGPSASPLNRDLTDGGDPIASASVLYAQALEQFFKAHPQIDAAIGAPDADPSLGEAGEVLRWYQMLICVKLRRATSDTESWGQGLEGVDQRYLDQAQMDDANGSAKVALLGIDASIKALDFLKSLDLIGASELGQSLVILRGMVERVLPRARAFVRPGLDEPHLW